MKFLIEFPEADVLWLLDAIESVEMAHYAMFDIEDETAIRIKTSITEQYQEQK